MAWSGGQLAGVLSSLPSRMSDTTGVCWGRRSWRCFVEHDGSCLCWASVTLVVSSESGDVAFRCLEFLPAFFCFPDQP